MLLASAVASGAFLLSATPPAFERTPAGEATDGQRIVHPASQRRQVFAIVPDRTTGRDWGLRYLREAVSDLNRTMPDAVFCVGDLVQGYSRSDAEVQRERNDFLGIVNRLSVPFYPTPGNHDLVSGRRDPSDRRFADDYKRRFGPLYYAVEAELASLVILNTEDGEGRIEPGFGDEQLKWLDATLASLEARGKPIILLFHRPLWDHAPTRWDERVQPMLVKHGVDYVIAGHYHALTALPPRDGIPYLLLGTCGGAIDQHPLAGQLQHISFVVVDESGSIGVYHQIAGCTLPVDWITKEDQDLAYRMKSSRNAVELKGSLADPMRRDTEGAIDVVLRNPLDRDVEFRLRAQGGPEAWQVVDRDGEGEITRVWTSRTAFDIFNPQTTDLSSPVLLEFESPSVMLRPKEERTVRVHAKAPAQTLPIRPPPFEIVAQFADSRERKVPILLRQRLPVARTIDVVERIADAIPYSISVWNWSEYDTPERDSTAWFTKGTGDSALHIAVEVPDTVLSPDAKPASGRPAIDDPLGDGVRIVLGEGPEAREFIVTFGGDGPTPQIRALSRDRSRVEPTKDLAATLIRSERLWRLELDVLRTALPAGGSIDGSAVNIGVADNDDTYHTQWRWLAPRTVPARIVASR